jgi:hypothetical protein
VRVRERSRDNTIHKSLSSLYSHISYLPRGQGKLKGGDAMPSQTAKNN